MLRLIAATIVALGCSFFSTARGGDPDRSSGPDHGTARLDRRADATRRGDGRGRRQCGRRRTRAAGAAHHGGRLLRSPSRRSPPRGSSSVTGSSSSSDICALESSIPASKVYEAAGVLQISPASTNPTLTEQGRANVFRVIGRDDAQGIVAGNYLADHWADKKIAILHDGTTYGKGLAEETKRQLNRRGVTEAIYEAMHPGKGRLFGRNRCVAGGGCRGAIRRWRYHAEVALMARGGTRPRLLTSAGLGRYHVDRGVWPHRRPRGRGHSLHLWRRPAPEAPKRRQSSSGFVPRASSLRVTRCLAMPPCRPGRRRSRRPARWSRRRSSPHCTATPSTPCWGRSPSTQRATSLFKAGCGMSGRAASTRR